MSCREHPAERMIFDEQGRPVTLGLSEAEIRLECLRLVAGAAQSAAAAPSGSLASLGAPTAAGIVHTARLYAAFVLGTDKDSPAEDGATAPAAEPDGIATANRRDYEKAREAFCHAVPFFAKANAAGPEQALSDIAVDQALSQKRDALVHEVRQARKDQSAIRKGDDRRSAYIVETERSIDALSRLLGLRETPPA